MGQSQGGRCRLMAATFTCAMRPFLRAIEPLTVLPSASPRPARSSTHSQHHLGGGCLYGWALLFSSTLDRRIQTFRMHARRASSAAPRPSSSRDLSARVRARQAACALWRRRYRSHALLGITALKAHQSQLRARPAASPNRTTSWPKQGAKSVRLVMRARWPLLFRNLALPDALGARRARQLAIVRARASLAFFASRAAPATCRILVLSARTTGSPAA
mmetsp:Transcript_88097/g.265144  ORF Transcript_88097/g.265144 Transcript_88097/m.265144 type:complete len:218 (+) Transcript_88097:702-1355(+)